MASLIIKIFSIAPLVIAWAVSEVINSEMWAPGDTFWQVQLANKPLNLSLSMLPLSGRCWAVIHQPTALLNKPAAAFLLCMSWWSQKGRRFPKPPSKPLVFPKISISSKDCGKVAVVYILLNKNHNSGCVMWAVGFGFFKIYFCWCIL